jgi:hypothetical protein
MDFDHIEREMHWQRQKQALRKMHQQEMDDLLQMQAARRDREANARGARLRTAMIKGRSPMSRLGVAIIWWYAMPPMPMIRKLRVARLLHREFHDEQFRHVEALSVEEALLRLGLPPGWNGTRAELNRHTKPLAEEAWRQQEPRALKLWEICWARRMLLDPGLEEASRAVRRAESPEPPEHTTAPKVVDQFRIDGTDYVTMGLTFPESVLTEWARAKERDGLAEGNTEILAPMTAHEAVEMIGPALMQEIREYLTDLLPDVEWPEDEET